jgi:hypothetical protein
MTNPACLLYFSIPIYLLYETCSAIIHLSYGFTIQPTFNACTLKNIGLYNFDYLILYGLRVGFYGIVLGTLLVLDTRARAPVKRKFNILLLYVFKYILLSILTFQAMYLGIKLLRTSYYWQLKEDLDKDLELLSEHLNSFNPCGQIGRSNTTLSWYFTIDEKFNWFWIGLVLQFINIILAGLFYINLLKIFKKSATQTKSSQNFSAYEKLRSPTCESKKNKRR